VNLALLLERGAGAAAATLVAVATVWIAAKMLRPEEHALVPYALWSLVPVLLMSLWWVSRSRVLFTQRDALILADHLRRNDAELPSRLERPDLYRGALPAAAQRLPRVRWSVPLRSVAPAAAYLLVVWAIPPSAVRIAPPNALLNMELDQLAAALENAPLAEEERESLLREIEELREDERELDRAQWEAIETVSERVDQTFEMAQQEITRVDMAAAKISQALSAASELPMMTADLGELGAQLAAAGAQLQRVSDPKLAELIERAASQCKGGQRPGQSPNAADLKALRGSLESLRKKLGECKGACEGDSEKSGSSNRPGKGGINRGRGDADLDFSNDMGEFDATTDPNLLAHEYQDQSQEIGILHLAPDPTIEQPTRSAEVAIDGAEGPGGAVRRTRITPSRRDLIQRYFSAEPSGGAAGAAGG
jgi:hypothetical protein